MNREFLSVISHLPLLLIIGCLATTLAAAETNPAPALPSVIVEKLKGKDPAKATKVDLTWSKVQDQDLAALKALTQLHRLNLSCTKVSDAGLEHLKGLTQLRVLGLAGTKISDAGLAHLKSLTQLQSLVLAETQVSDAGLAHLNLLAQLKDL